MKEVTQQAVLEEAGQDDVKYGLAADSASLK